MMGISKRRRVIVSTVIVPIIAVCSLLITVKAEELSPSIIQLRILETTDLHANMLDYNYKKNKSTIEFGLARTATLIHQARAEVQNSMLFDNGDLIEGNALGKYAVLNYKNNSQFSHPVYRAMNLLNYDAATLGNHEFNFGIDFMLESIKAANFPYVNANIYIEDNNNFEIDDINFFNPYTILKKQFIDTSGKVKTLNVGVIGLITPIFYEWDKEHVKGKVKVKDIVDTAEHFIPIMKEQGADIIIALAHNGMDSHDSLKNKDANNLYSLSKVKGIDAILFGHSHSVFPGQDSLRGKQGIDSEKGTIHGVPAVQAGFWGNHLGVMDLYIEKAGGEWKVTDSQSSVRPIYRTKNGKKKPVVDPDENIVRVMEKSHLKTLEFLKKRKQSHKK